MTDNLIYANGIFADTGEPLLPPLPLNLVATIATGTPINAEDLAELRARRRMLAGEADYGVMANVDPDDLAQAGWGVIFAFDDEAQIPAIRDALGPLLELRRQQAGDRYRDASDDPKFLYRPGESKNAWLARNGGAPGPVDPRKVPYYLQIVGDPEKIPFRFQHQLDVAFAVGRLHFDNSEQYHSYARSVVVAETGSAPARSGRKATFFGVQNGRDPATSLSTRELIAPLSAALAQNLPDWEIDEWTGAQATKRQLLRLLGGDQTPAFLFSASHGIGFNPSDHQRQLAEQGALVCSDWRGAGPVTSNMWLSAGDIGQDAQLGGIIAFLFACYGGGTPQFDDFAVLKRQQDQAAQGQPVTGLEQMDRIEIAPRSFLARLPQRLLGHPNGGALAVVGHVDRAWGASFLWEGVRQFGAFESSLTRLLQGARLGAAMEDFNNRYAELSTELTARIEAIKFREIVPPEELAGLWLANNDARNYSILGDPAVKLVAADPSG